MAEYTASRAAKADVFYKTYLPLLILVLIGGVVLVGWYVLTPPSGCQNMHLTPITKITDGAGRQVEIFEVPAGSWVVARMDGVYKVLNPGENFITGMGIYVCQSPHAAQEEVIKLNTRSSP